MDTPSPSLRSLARRLLAQEAARRESTEPGVNAAVAVCEKLRLALTRFAGADASTMLLRRALALARVEVPALSGLAIQRDSSLEGLDALAAGEPSGGLEATAALTAHLLGLLVTFIGEPLTLRMVREAWPDASLDE